MSSLSSVGSASPSISGLGTTTAGTTAAGNTTASNQGPLAVNGLISGLNTSAIITGLLAVQQAQITNLQTQQQTLTSQDTAFKGIEAKLLALQSDAAQLARSQSGPFAAKQAVSSDTTQINAAASSDATAGVYTLQVNSLATAEQIASQGFASLTSSITQGTFQIQVGHGAATSITVDGTNDTLQGLATAINNSGAPVTATIVNDGSAAQPYRLLLTSNQSGADNKITISNSLAADAGAASKPVFDASYIGQAATGSGYSGTSTPTANVGAGTYTGTTNNTYTFTVVNGGTVGTDNGIQLSYTDTSGQHTGTINLSASDAGVLQNVDQGIQVQFSAGTLVQGQTFSLNAYTPVVQPGASASVTLGSGAGALTVQSDSNTVDGLINGVTLSLVGADANNPVTVTVGSNTTSASQSIQNFVQDYNNFITSVNSQVSYDSQTQTAGVLLGQSAATGIESQVQGLVLNTVQGLNPLLNQLGALGITPNTDGTLTVNTTQLNATLSGQTPGVTLDDVRQLFALAGQSTNSAVQFVTGTDQTKAGTYQVNITQAATQGSLTATNGLAASTIINNTNNTLNFTVDGQTSQTLTLAAGTYTPAALANELQAEINGNSSLAGRNVTVTVNNHNQLVVTSASFGSSSNVAVGTGSALTPSASPARKAAPVRTWPAASRSTG